MTPWRLIGSWYLYALRLAKAERLGPVYWHNNYGPFWDTADPVYRFDGTRKEND